MIHQSKAAILDWAEWQNGVLTILRHDLEEVLPSISLAEVDWDSWQNYFLIGCAPQSAVNRALERGI
jgi:hypothetical protein